MSDHDWVSVGEYSSGLSAGVVSVRLTTEGIPHRIVPSLDRRDPTCSIWVPPEVLDRAKALLSRDAVPEDELTKAALSYPPPDDADDLK